ncbi:MAG: ANTAR domain-containing protein [Phycisphaera sp.]|nr:ANTAR domain-containing protein [Phycisphaera sp.]
MSDTASRVLVVQDDGHRQGSITHLLTSKGYAIAAIAGPTSILADLVAEHTPDVVLIDATKLTGNLLVNVTAAQRIAPHPVAVIFQKADDKHSVDDAIAAGVAAIHYGAATREQLAVLIESARALFDHDQQVRHQLEHARAALNERKIVERAKGILMDQRGLGEAEAYRRLRTLAMNRKRRIADVARDVIEMADILGDESAKAP